MNVVFMIGNGFDLNCGMKTSYKDVYAGYCKTRSSSDEIQKFKDRIAGDIETWSDFEVAMAEDMKNFNSEESFIYCLRNFKRHLKEYLKKEENDLLEAIYRHDYDFETLNREWDESIKNFCFGDLFVSEERKEEMRKIEKRIKGGNEENRVLFVSYNYTVSLEIICRIIGKNISVIHPHGTLNDGQALGMDNIGQLTYGNFPMTKKTSCGFLKPEFNKRIDSKRVKKAANEICEADVICVFGLSLGISDFCWAKFLLGEMRDRTDVFFFDYNLKKYDVILAEDLMDEKERLFTLWGVPEEDWETYKPYFHVGWKDIFNFGKAFLPTD